MIVYTYKGFRKRAAVPTPNAVCGPMSNRNVLYSRRAAVVRRDQETQSRRQSSVARTTVQARRRW